MTSSHHTPDERDLLDFADAVAAGQNPQPVNDLERTYLHVHNAMQGDSAAIPSTTKQSTWEEVMSTLALTPEAPVSNRTRRQHGLSSPPPAPRARRMQWTPLASVAAALLVVIASFGMWQINQTPSEPPLAPQMAGITSGDDIAQVVAIPDATAVADESGDYSIPIIQRVDEQPMDGPVIWLTNAGDVMYDDGSGEVTTIASEVDAVIADMPNIIQLVSEGEATTDKAGNPSGNWMTTWYNVVTGETLTDDGTFSSIQGSPNSFGPLTVLTVTDAPNEWSVVNFQTMESKSVSELTGGHFPSSELITAYVSETHSAIAIATSQHESEGSATLMRQSGLPGEIAVIPADLSGVSWVAVPEDMPPVGNIALSPDGTKLALISAPFNQEGASTTISVIDIESTISVIDIESGDELVRTSPMTYKPLSFFQWVEDGEAFIAVNGETIERYALDGSEPTVLLEAEGSLMLMPRIGISDLLHVMVTSSDLSTSAPDPTMTQFVILNTATGETIAVDGEPWFRGYSGSPEPFMTPLAPVPVKQEDGSRRLVHPVTGETFGTVTELETGTPVPTDIMILEVTRMPVASAEQAPISVVRIDETTIQVFTTTAEGFEVEEFELPGDMNITKLDLSPDGRYLIAGSISDGVPQSDSAWAVLDLSNPEAGWVQGEDGQLLTFVEIRED